MEWIWTTRNWNEKDQNRFMKIDQLTSVVGVSAGYIHSMALGSEGQVWSFGDNFWGQLGHKTIGIESSPTLIENIPPMKVIHCITFCSFTMDCDGNWWYCGRHADGELGISNNEVFCRPIVEYIPAPPSALLVSLKSIVVARARVLRAVFSNGSTVGIGGGEMP